MASAPMGPSSSDSKSFWSKPEGKTGMIFIGAGILAAIWFWGLIIPFVLSMLVDTFHAALLAAGLGVMLWLVTSKRVRWIMRLLMRWITGWVINIDPIGILEDHLLEMKKRRDEMNEQISRVSGSKQMLEDTIAKNKQASMQNMRLAEQAKKMSAAAADANKKLEFDLQMRAKANQAGRLAQSNVGYEKLLQKITNLYNLLTKWATNIDYFIEDTENQVKEAKIQKKVIDAASGAFQKAMAIFRGNAGEEDIYDRTMEHLADEASMKLGQIDDFQRMATNFMDTIDVQNGAVETSALEALDKYEQKVLTSGDQNTAFLLPGVTAGKEPVKAAGAAATDSGYDDIFTK